MMKAPRKYCFILCFILIGTFASNMVEGKMLSTNTSNANIRSGPGTNHEILWQANKYYPFKILKKQGKWYYFMDFEQDKGWIHASLVSHIPSLVVKVGEANVRSGPGKKYPLVFKALRGVSFRVLKVKGNWAQVKHEDGDTGWIYRSLLWGYTQ